MNISPTLKKTVAGGLLCGGLGLAGLGTGAGIAQASDREPIQQIGTAMRGMRCSISTPNAALRRT